MHVSVRVSWRGWITLLETSSCASTDKPPFLAREVSSSKERIEKWKSDFFLVFFCWEVEKGGWKSCLEFPVAGKVFLVLENATLTMHLAAHIDGKF